MDRSHTTLDALEPRQMLSTTLSVPATANPWYIAGSTASGTTPPSYTFAAGPNQVLTFSHVTGQVNSVGPTYPTWTADGATGPADLTDILGVGGISGIYDSGTSGIFPLVGVFTTDTIPTNNSPTDQNYANIMTNASFSPQLNQVFFIGDGLTGNGTGATQQFFVPTGATHLYLGFPDGTPGHTPGYYDTNYGSVDATFSVNLIKGDITGFAYIDANGNGIKDSHEQLMQGVKVYIDANNNGVFDSGEQFVLTDARGRYSFAQLDAGNYRIRAVAPTGYRQTAPRGRPGYYLVSVPAAKERPHTEFGFKKI